MHRTPSLVFLTGRECGSNPPLVSLLARYAAADQLASFFYSMASHCSLSDALEDHRFAASGIVLDEGVRCRSYAGAPLFSSSGMILGTIAVCSLEANAFSRSNLENLQVLARQVSTRLELYATGHVQESVVRSRQRSEQALTVERNFVSAVLNTISALVLVFDTAGRIVRFNRACETISGYTFARPGRPRLS